MNKFSFTPATFKLLCTTLDSILLSCRSPYVTSVDWLHVLRPHPVFLKRYDFLFSKVSRQLSQLFLDLAKNISTFLVDFSYALLNRNIHPPLLSVTNPPDIIFVTHLLDGSHLDKSTDFYYGDLGESLSQDGISVLFLCINHTKSPFRHLREMSRSTRYDRLILPVGRDSLYLLFSSLCWSLKSFIQLLYCLPRSRTYSHFLAVLFAASNSFSRGTRLSFFLQHYLNKIIQPNTKGLVSTYEGFAWERIVFSTCHDLNPSISTFGYMHALVFKDQHSVFRRLDKRYEPRYILTAGTTPREYLLKNLGLSESTVFELGSPRSICSSTASHQSSLPSSSPTILVLPEGILEECLLLFRFSLKCALINPTVTFRWRTHPLISLESVASIISCDFTLPPNIVVSETSFDSDIFASQYCLYRGSTAVVTAASSGLIPIYYKVSDFPDTDPLFCLSSYRPTVSKSSSFSNALHWSSWNSHAINLCQQLYTPLNSNLFAKHEIL